VRNVESGLNAPNRLRLVRSSRDALDALSIFLQTCGP